MDDSKYDEAIELLNQIPEYKDSQSKIEEAKKGKMQADFAKYVFNFIKDGEFYNPSKVRVTPNGDNYQYGFDINDQGIHIVKFDSCDKAGNCSNYTGNKNIKISLRRS